MSQDAHLSQTIEMPGEPVAEHGAGSASVVPDFSGSLVALTWGTFLVMVVILYKVAWKPILHSLTQRENSIRKALEDAEKARAALAEIEGRGRAAAAEAEAHGNAILEDARRSAANLAGQIEKKARDEACAMKDAAERQIQEAAEKARAALRRDSAELAVLMAGKLIGETMDPARQKVLVERLSKEI